MRLNISSGNRASDRMAADTCPSEGGEGDDQKTDSWNGRGGLGAARVTDGRSAAQTVAEYGWGAGRVSRQVETRPRDEPAVRFRGVFPQPRIWRGRNAPSRDGFAGDSKVPAAAGIVQHAGHRRYPSAAG